MRHLVEEANRVNSQHRMPGRDPVRLERNVPDERSYLNYVDMLASEDMVSHLC